MTVVGTASRRRPCRAARSRVRGWSQRITLCVRVPAFASETAKPCRRVKHPPLTTGRSTGIRVRSLKAAGETIRTGRVPLCSRPAEGSRLTSQISPRFTTRVRCRQAWHRAMRDPRRKAGRHRHTVPGVSRGCIWDVSSAQRSGDRLPHRYPLWPHAEVQEIEQCRGTASMTEPPTLRRFVVCMGRSNVMFSYNLSRSKARVLPNGEPGMRGSAREPVTRPRDGLRRASRTTAATKPRVLAPHGRRCRGRHDGSEPR